MRIAGKRGRKPFEIKLSDAAREDLALELARALDDALAARSASESEVEYWHQLYEQARTRNAHNSPWADAADLTSWLGTQYVDVMRAHIVQTVMAEPVWTVEGYGEAAKNAPYVEEFHQWQQEAEGFQGVFARAVHLALIEPSGVIEVFEDRTKRPVRKVIHAALQTDPQTRQVLIGEDSQPLLQRRADGTYVEALDEQTPSAELEIDSWEVVARGPRERVVAWRDYLRLPGHATDKSEVWGHAKRFFRRLDDLKDRARQGQYDKTAVDQLGTDDERPSETTLAGTPLGVAPKDGSDLIEKELWELTILRDLDGKGLRWYVVTLHKDKRILLRIQYDDIGRPRYFPLVPFPRPNSLEGYSYIGHKLITVLEEHTAWRNMTADDAAMQLQLPIIRQQGALWEPEEQPLGPKSVIDVRQKDEISFLQRQPNNAVGVERIRDAERSGERLAGINDAAAGVQGDEKRTLGEIQLVTQQSMGRISEAVKNIQETLEELAQVRHLMWKRALADMGDEGMDAPPSVAEAIQLRQSKFPAAPQTTETGMEGMSLGPPTDLLLGLEQRVPQIVTTTQPEPLKFTSQMLEGTFRFKPRGSVESADKNQQRYNWNQFILAMSSFAKINPMIAMLLQTPQAAKALVEHTLRLYNVPDKQPFLGSEALSAAMQQLQGVQQQAMAGAQPKANYLPAKGPDGQPPPQPGGAPPPSPTIGQGVNL